MHETYSLHKDGGSANKPWRFHKNWLSSTMSVKAERTKLLFKLSIPGTNSMKAVAVYLNLILKEQFVKFPPEIIYMPCGCCWSVGNHNHFYRNSDIQIFLNGDILLNGS